LATEVVVQIEQATGIQLSGTRLLLRPTVASVAAWLDSPGASSRVIPLQPLGSGPAFFCVHGLSGDVFEFVQLAKCLAPEQPVYGLQAHTEGGRPMILSVKEMATLCVRGIRSVQPNGPYYLGGFSSGGTIAFEVAQRLRSEGETVALLALFDSLYPGYLRSLPSRSWKQRIPLHALTLLRMQVQDVAAYVRQRAATLRERTRRKVWKIRFKSHLAARRPLPDSLLKIGEVHRQAIEEYQPQSYFGRVVLFRSLERRGEPDLDLDLGWSGSVPGGVEVHEVPGDHVTMLTTQVLCVAEGLKACLEDARETRTPVALTDMALP
jgi:thioesterase domain-containing protein